MRKTILWALKFSFLFGCLLLAAAARAEANILPAPTLLAPNELTVTADLTPAITGLTKNGTSVKIFIDGAFDGEIDSLSHPSGTANFSYRPSVNLSRGRHKVYAVAVDQAGAISQPSVEMNFVIEWPMPAPTMIKAVVNKNTVAARPFITGLAKNNSRIKVYIDQKYSGEFMVKTHPSGTANFAYRPGSALTRGLHRAYTVAIDKRGKASITSNEVVFAVRTAAIARAASEQRKYAVAGIKESRPSSSQPPAGAVSPSTGQITKPADDQPPSLAEVSNLLGTTSAKTQTSAGLINEGKENQSKLKVSLVIFILFLLGVVAWLLWVNRELIKERRSQVMPEEKKNQPNSGQDDKLL